MQAIKQKLTNFLMLIVSNHYYEAIPDENLIAKQRYKLFRAFSMASFVVCVLFTVQTVSLFNISNLIVYMITTIGVLLATNFYLLPKHRKPRLAFILAALLSLTLLHIQTDYSGGIRASGSLYLSSVILMSFMLLGNRIGRWIALLAAAQIAYFYCINTYYPEMIKENPSKEDIDRIAVQLLSKVRPRSTS